MAEPEVLTFEPELAEPEVLPFEPEPEEPELLAFEPEVEAPEAEEVDIARGIELGFKRAILPTQLTTEEVTLERTTGGAVAEAITNIATDIATTAVAGAALGTVFPIAGTTAGLISGAALAIYRGLGNESVASKAKGREFDPAKALLSVAVEANPLHRFTGKIVKGISQVGLQFGEVAAQDFLFDETGELNKAVAIGAVVAGGVAGALSGPSRRQATQAKAKFDHGEYVTRPNLDGSNATVTKEFSNKVDELYGDELGQQIIDAVEEVEPIQFVVPDYVRHAVDEGKKAKIKTFGGNDILSTKQLAKKYNFVIERGDFKDGVVEDNFKILQFGQNVKDKEIRKEIIDRIEKDQNRFIKWARGQIVGEPKVKDFKDAYAQLGKEEGGEAWLNFDYAQFVRQEASLVEMKRLVRGTDVEELVDPAGFMTQFSDNLLVARRTDTELKGITNFETVVMAASEAENRVAAEMTPWINAMRKRILDFKKNNIDPRKVREVLETEGSTDPDVPDLFAPLNPAQKESIRAYQKVIEDTRVWLNEAKGLNIQKLGGGRGENYFTHASTSSSEIVKRLRLGVAAEDSNRRESAFDVIDRLLQTRVRRTPKDAEDALKRIIRTPKEKLRNTIEGGFGRERKGTLTDFELENDPGKVYLQYLSSMLKTTNYRKVLQNAEQNIVLMRGLEKQGIAIKKTREHWETWQGRLTGSKPSPYKEWVGLRTEQMKDFFNKALSDEDAGFLKRAGAQTGLFIPELLGFMQASAYPNLLGYNIRAPLRNMTQTWFLTAPELAPDDLTKAYGWGLVRRGWVNATKELKTLKIKGVEDFLEKNGWKGGQFIGEGDELLADSVSLVPGLGWAVKQSEKVGQMGMWLYTQSDNANRFITYHAAKALVADALAGNQKAMGFFKRLTPAIGQQAIDAIRKKDSKQLEKVVADHLISKTQYLYNRASLSNFGLQFGRLVSMFSKWPLMTIGDVAEIYRRKDYMHGAVKYLTPLAVLGLGGVAIDAADGFERPETRLLFGNGIRSMLGWAPLASLTGISVPPIMQTGVDIAKAGKDLITGDPSRAVNGAMNSLVPFIPFVKPIDRATGFYEELKDF